jgi:hypothetical protein
MSEKYLPKCRDSKELERKDPAHLPKCYHSELLKEMNRNRRKELIKIYNKYEATKATKTSVESEQLIRNLKQRDDRIGDTLNPLLKTISIPKDHKHSPYFVFPTKKFNEKS